MRRNVTASVRLEDALRGAPGATYRTDPGSVLGGMPHAEPSANILNVRAAVRWSDFEVAALLRNALNAHPLMYGLANGVDLAGTSTQVTTLVPRTFTVSGTWRF